MSEINKDRISIDQLSEPMKEPTTDQRTLGPTNKRTYGRTDLRTNERTDGRRTDDE